MNDSFSFDSSIACSEFYWDFMGKSLVIAVRSLTKQQNSLMLMYMRKTNSRMALTSSQAAGGTFKG